MNFKTNLKMDRKAVSEVIATILLISLTIVITGTIWFWVQSYVPTKKAGAPHASLSVDVSDVDKGVVYVYVNEVSETIGINNVEYSLYDRSGVRIAYGDLSDSAVYGSIFIDSNHNGVLDHGDFFIFDISVANNCTFSLIHKDLRMIIASQDILV